MMHRKTGAVLIITIIISCSIMAQDSPDTLREDTTREAARDSSFFFFSDEPEDTVEYYIFFDSLKSRFFIENLELSERLEGSFNHDPTDYLKFFPSYTIINYQNLPMRRTVSPLGLPGSRNNVVFDTRQINPLEHVVEPDGKTDFEDYPIHPANRAWNIEGPLGLAFNADNAFGTLFLSPYKNLEGPARSYMQTDNGSYGFADTRGVFASRSKNGRVIKAGAQYRKADGSAFFYDDDAYHQWAEVVYPLNDRNRLSLYGRLYKRDGYLPFRPDYSGDILSQFRRDRDFVFAYQRDHRNGGRSTLEFRHQRSESSLRHRTTPADYDRKIDAIDNGGHFRHENRMAGFDAALGLFINFRDYTDRGWENKRKRAMTYANILKGDSAFAWTLYGSVEKLGGYNPAPSGMISLISRSDSFYWQLSAGYKTKFPRQYELDLEPLFGDISDIESTDYFESGNSLLEPEKQLVASFNAGLGQPGNDWQLSVTGGRIIDGIDWSHYYLDTLDASYDAFRPVNHDIDFISGTLLKRISLWDRIWLYGGATYRYVKVGANDSPAYSPDYQGFAAIELYQYVNFIETHLYGYLEAVMLGEYNTPNAFQSPGLTLGNEAVVNLKLTLRIKKFRLYFVSQNLLATFYAQRDGYNINDRFAYYGITWHFLD